MLIDFGAGIPRTWVVIDAPRFEEEYRFSIYDVELEVSDRYPDVLTDLHLLNIVEYGAERMAAVLPEDAEVAFYRSLAYYAERDATCRAIPSKFRSIANGRDLLKADLVLRPLRSYYLDLQQRSEDARYKCVVFTPAGVRNVRTRAYQPLEFQLRTVLGI